MIISTFAGRRLTSTLLVSCEDRNTETGVGRNPMPVIREEWPWMSWRNWVRKKTIPYIPA